MSHLMSQGLGRMCSIAASAALAILAANAHADDAIPYPSSGTVNPVSYTFTAAATGDVLAYFVSGGGAGDDNQLGLLVNGVLSAAGYGLDNHTSSVGDSFDFGPVQAGDTLVFVLHNLTLGKDAYSDPSLNVAYDDAGVTVHNHVYSAPYTATSPLFAGVPAGAYVAFEDLPFPGADDNYNDESFVVTNATVTAVPEPASALLIAVGALGVAAAVRRRIPAPARSRQTRSSTSAMPWPTPMHMVHSA